VRQHLGLVLLIGLAIVTGQRFVLLLLPTAVSLFLLGTFGWSLHAGPPIIERFARLVDPDLPDFCVPIAAVTIAWCAFMAANAICATLLAVSGHSMVGSLHGARRLLVVGALFAGEFVLRKLWFRFYGDSLADRILARASPSGRQRRRSLAYVEPPAPAISSQRLKISEC
jgi:uncharacterized membrane protein